MFDMFTLEDEELVEEKEGDMAVVDWTTWSRSRPW